MMKILSTLLLVSLSFSSFSQNKLLNKVKAKVTEAVENKVLDALKGGIGEKAKQETNSFLEELLFSPEVEAELEGAEPEVLEAQRQLKKELLRGVNKGMDSTFSKENLKFDWEIKKEAKLLEEKSQKEKAEYQDLKKNENKLAFEDAIKRAISEGKYLFAGISHQQFEHEKIPYFEREAVQNFIEQQKQLKAFTEKYGIAYHEYLLSHEYSPFSDQILGTKTLKRTGFFIIDPNTNSIVYSMDGLWPTDLKVPYMEESIKIHEELRASNGRKILFVTNLWYEKEASFQQNKLNDLITKYQINKTFKVIVGKYPAKETITEIEGANKMNSKIFIANYNGSPRFIENLSTIEFIQDPDLFFSILIKEKSNSNEQIFEIFKDKGELLTEVKNTKKPIITLSKWEHYNDRDYTRLLQNDELKNYLKSEYIVLQDKSLGEKFRVGSDVTLQNPFMNNTDILGTYNYKSDHFTASDLLFEAKKFKEGFLKSIEDNPEEWIKFGEKPEIKQGNGIKFNEDTWDNIQQRASKENKKILIYMYANWAGQCKYFEQKVFIDNDIEEYFNENYLCYKINGDLREEKDNNLISNIERERIIKILLQTSSKINVSIPSFYIFSGEKLNEHVRGILKVEDFLNFGKRNLLP